VETITFIRSLPLAEFHGIKTMALFAHLDENNRVIGKIKIEDSRLIFDGSENESLCANWIAEFTGKDNNWKQFKKDGSIRKNTAVIGCYYDPIRDAFINDQPFASWTLDESTCCWVPPIERPEGFYAWDESAYQSDNTKGWIEK